MRKLPEIFDCNRPLILDGAMGTMLQKHGLSGDSEMFNLTHPGTIEAIHKAYIDAGADIIETNTFGANRISQAEYGNSDKAYEMALAGARTARKAADGAGRNVLVAGSIGPTSKSLSMGVNVDDPAWRPISFDELADAYQEQISGLVDGGADLLLIETCFDALNVKAALYARERLGSDIPVIISASCADRSGRTLTGQTTEAFYTAVKHCNPIAFGLNCSLGAKEMMPLVAEVAEFVHKDGIKVICYPNAGLPNELGQYDQTPQEMALTVADMVRNGWADIVGGCCGTTPEHIKAIADAVRGMETTQAVRGQELLTVSGLEAVTIDIQRNNFTNIGERTNVAGSRKFARLIASGDYPSAISVAAGQIEGGATIIDINMDDAMLDGTAEMEKFVRYIQTEPSVAKAALMIDSSHWDTILAGLKNAQGKCIVNSISLKEGEEEFLRKALEIKRLGAAMVVMAFDEEGQATTFDRKVAICERAYGLLTGIGVRPCDIIFDVNVLTVGTGAETDRRYAVDFIEAVRWIKANLPGALTSGGISNLSFAFRGNNPVREAMHSVFLYHAIKAGLDMAILNPGMLQIYDTINPELCEAVEDVILDRRDEATERLLDMAGKMAGQEVAAQPGADAVTDISLPQMLVKGISDGLETKVKDALDALGNAQSVIQGPLMEGMEKVGELFGSGKMFLPQVVKSARIMRLAVDMLQPYMQAGDDDTAKRPTVVIATVKGDVHDIGKDITATVLTCNGFNVVNLGVMVDNETILREAQRRGADIVAASGLITPSLARMEELCREMASRGMHTPLLIGGATTSALHTAVKLAPVYDHVFYGPDASATAVLAKKLMAAREETEAQEHARQEKIRMMHNAAKSGTGCSEGLFSYLPEDGFAPSSAFAGQDIDVQEIPVEELIPLFDWRTFLAIWGIKAADYDRPEVAAIKAEAEEKLAGIHCTVKAGLHFGEKYGYFAASVHGDHADGCNCPECNDMMEKTLRLVLADAASEWIERHISVPEGYKLIRPAVGYPSCPDHALKKAVLDAIPDSGRLGITLTESYAMIPDASVCGYIIIHKNARYL